MVSGWTLVSKLLDSAPEVAQTQTWLAFDLISNCMTTDVYEELYENVFAMLNMMENEAEIFCNEK
jgi:hypothetical protein